MIRSAVFQQYPVIRLEAADKYYKISLVWLWSAITEQNFLGGGFGGRQGGKLRRVLVWHWQWFMFVVRQRQMGMKAMLFILLVRLHSYSQLCP